MQYTDMVGLAGWLAGGMNWMVGYTLGVMDWTGMEWNGAGMILLLCVLIFDIFCSNYALIRLYVRARPVFLPRQLPHVLL